MQAIIKDERFKSFIWRIKSVCDFVHIEGHDDTIRVMAYDGRITCSATFGALLEVNGKVCLKTKLLSNVLSGSYGHSVHIKNLGSDAEVNIHNRSYTLPNYNHDMPEVKLDDALYPIMIHRKYFVEQTGKLRRFVQDYYGNNAANTHFVAKHGLFTAEATNGHDMYRVHLANYNQGGIDDEFMVNTETLMKFRKTICVDAAKLLVHKDAISMQIGNELYYARIERKQWFDTQKITDRDTKFTIEVNKADLEGAMNRLSCLADEMNSTTMEFGKNTVLIRNCSNSESVACTFHKKQTFDKIGIAPQAMAESIKDMKGSQLNLHFTGSNTDPIIMTTDDDSMIAIVAPANYY